MSKFKKGDIVICKKHDVRQKLVCDKNVIRFENYIDDYFFNREAVIEYTYKECMEEYLGNDPHEEVEDKELYGIMFFDNSTTLSFVRGDELILKVPVDNLPNKYTAEKNEQQEVLLGDK